MKVIHFEGYINSDDPAILDRVMDLVSEEFGDDLEIIVGDIAETEDE